MKVLMLSLYKIWYRVGKISHSKDESLLGKTYEDKDCLFIMIHVEAKDQENENSVLRKLVKNITWYSRKTNNKKIILHSFAHLSEDKADPEYAQKIINMVKEKLQNKGLDVHTTPFGYFLELEIKIKPEPIARVFKDL
ncbi:MAG: threonyl-tRNA synthetase editing domain-containing protein [Candidatus Njordarchaeota archaeon]